MKFFHTFKIGLRNLLRERFYTILNILGFACGITVFAFVSIYVIDQYLYDRIHDDSDRIYRLEAFTEAGEWALTGTMQGHICPKNTILGTNNEVCSVFFLHEAQHRILAGSCRPLIFLYVICRFLL